MFFSLAVSLFVLSLLVFVHEFGHFIAAKKAGIKVEEFGFGYPPRLFGVTWGGTTYSVNLIPFGGFVKIYGLEKGIEEEGRRTGEGRAFWAKSKRVRATVLSAGILMNFLLGVLAFSLIYSFLGIPQKLGFVAIVAVAKGSPAEKAGIKEGDVIRRITNYELRITNNKEFVEIVNENLGKEIELELERQGVTLSVVAVPRKEPPEGEGPLGVAITDIKMTQLVFYKRPFVSFWFGTKEAVGWAGAIFFGIGKMLYDFGFRGIVPKDITGPVGILQIASGVARAGFFALLQFSGALSVNLAVLNLLPIPALDGGRLLFLAVEAVTGKKPKPKFERWIHTIGMVILLLLMLAITIQDISRILQGPIWPF